MYIVGSCWFHPRWSCSWFSFNQMATVFRDKNKKTDPTFHRHPTAFEIIQLSINCWSSILIYIYMYICWPAPPPGYPSAFPEEQQKCQGGQCHQRCGGTILHRWQGAAVGVGGVSPLKRLWICHSRGWTMFDFGWFWGRFGGIVLLGLQHWIGNRFDCTWGLWSWFPLWEETGRVGIENQSDIGWFDTLGLFSHWMFLACVEGGQTWMSHHAMPIVGCWSWLFRWLVTCVPCFLFPHLPGEGC